MAIGKSSEFFRGKYSFKATSLFFSSCCLFLIDSISECKQHFFFPYCRLMPIPAFTVIDIQLMLSIAVDSASLIIGNVNPLANDLKIN